MARQPSSSIKHWNFTFLHLRSFIRNELQKCIYIKNPNIKVIAKQPRIIADNKQIFVIEFRDRDSDTLNGHLTFHEGRSLDYKKSNHYTYDLRGENENSVYPLAMDTNGSFIFENTTINSNINFKIITDCIIRILNKYPDLVLY